MELRYLGFDQLRNARAFRFDIITKGESTRQAVVTADMALFLQHHVSIQDGPTLCAVKLTGDIERSFDGEHVLTADDLRAHSEARVAAETKRVEARRMAGRRHNNNNNNSNNNSNNTAASFENPRGRF